MDRRLALEAVKNQEGISVLEKLSSLVSNGQFVASVVTLVDAIFGVLLASGSVHTSPDQGVVAATVALTFNAAGLILSYLQHQQHTQKMQLAHEVSQDVAYRAAQVARDLATGTAYVPEATAPAATPATQ
jgi:hypothetical protein